jgi:hypothetical protein
MARLLQMAQPDPGGAIATPPTAPVPVAKPDDRILPTTRALAAIIVPVSLLAWVILYLMPDRTGEIFAWAIHPRMTAMSLGGAYLGGVYLFTWALVGRRWHRVTLAFPPVTAFATLLGIATVLHWDKFRHGHIPFQVWAGLYFVTPSLVLVAWLVNRRTDPGTTEELDLVLPRAVRSALAAVGAVTVLTSALLFLAPHAMIDVWPWRLTPLTSRVWSAMFALTGLADIGIALDARWSAARTVLQSQLISLVMIDVAMLFCLDDFDTSRPLTWVLLPGLVALAVGGAALLVTVDRRRVRSDPASW